MSSTAHARARGGAVAIGIAQCLLLTLGALVVVTWSFLELTKRLALSPEPLSADRVLFWSLVGGLAVLVMASVAAVMLWRGRAVGFTMLALAWVPAAPLAWVTIASYGGLVVDERMPGVVTASLVAAGANVVLGWVLRSPSVNRPPVVG